MTLGDIKTASSTANKVLVGLSGGVDSSVAAAVLGEAGFEVVGVTLKLWGGETDSGCCSVSDVEDARRVAHKLGIEHHVFNFGDDFVTKVVDPYVDAFAKGLMPNPCIECNRHIKFDKLFRWADTLGFKYLATGHHAQIFDRSDGTKFVQRGYDDEKDQSYVLHMLDQPQLRRVKFPIGHMTKTEVREKADMLGLGTAAKPDSQNVCFINSASGRAGFLRERIELRPGKIVDETSGGEVGSVKAMQLVTIGQRKGLGLGGNLNRRYVVAKDDEAGEITIGPFERLLVDSQMLLNVSWVAETLSDELTIQSSAHGKVLPGRIIGTELVWSTPQMRISEGQSVVAYVDGNVVASGIAGRIETTHEL